MPAEKLPAVELGLDRSALALQRLAEPFGVQHAQRVDVVLDLGEITRVAQQLCYVHSGGQPEVTPGGDGAAEH